MKTLYIIVFSILATGVFCSCLGQAPEKPTNEITINLGVRNEVSARVLASSNLYDLIVLVKSEATTRESYYHVNIHRKNEGRSYRFMLRGENMASEGDLRAFKLKDSDLVLFTELP